MWDIIPRCVISNHFWWLEIPKHIMFLCIVVFLCYVNFCLEHGVLIFHRVFWSMNSIYEIILGTILLLIIKHSISLGLDSCIVSNEPCFESSKVTSWVLCNFRSSIVCMGFVITNVVEQVLFSMLCDVSFFFVGCFGLFTLQLGRRCNERKCSWFEEVPPMVLWFLGLIST